MHTKPFYTHQDDNLQVALRIIDTFGLKPAMTQAQYRKGTYMFSDPLEPGVRYAMYANGYYRKYSNGTCYQLNKQTRKKAFWGGYTTTGRILIPGDYTTMALNIIGIIPKSRERYQKRMRARAEWLRKSAQMTGTYRLVCSNGLNVPTN